MEKSTSKGVKDMTKGPVMPILLKFSLPLLVSVIFQQLYSIADSIIAGNFVGVDALAAIGASYPITMIYLAFGTGMNVGCAVVISTYFGAKDYSSMKTSVFTTLIASTVLGAVLTVAGYLTSGMFLRLLSTDAAVFDDAQGYLNVYVFGLIFMFLYNICNGIFAALGDSNTPLFFLIGSSVSNVLMDLLFVAVFQMGVMGTAWATFICQAVCAVLAFIVLMRRIAGIKCGKFAYFRWRMLGKVAKFSVPSILQQSFVSVGNLFIQGLVNQCGVEVMAGYASAIKLNTFAVTCFSTIGNASSSFTAQNTGACEYMRIRRGFRVAAGIAEGLAVVLLGCYLIFANNLIYLFMDSTAENAAAAAEAGVGFLRIVSPFFLAVSLKVTIDGTLRGGGMLNAFMISTFSDLVLRVGFAFILYPYFSEKGIWMSWPVGWSIAMVMSALFYVFYARGIMRKSKEIANYNNG